MYARQLKELVNEMFGVWQRPGGKIWEVILPVNNVLHVVVLPRGDLDTRASTYMQLAMMRNSLKVSVALLGTVLVGPPYL